MSQAIGSTSAAYARAWHHFNLQDQILGKAASRIAQLLMGKHKPIYDPSSDCGDYVVVTNANALALTGKKDEQKVYRSHTGWKLKEISYKQMLDRHPEQIIKKAVSGMLPKNKLRDRRLERLKVYLENDHPFKSNILTVYDAQSAFRQPQSPPPTSAAAAQSKPAS